MLLGSSYSLVLSFGSIEDTGEEGRGRIDGILGDFVMTYGANSLLPSKRDTIIWSSTQSECEIIYKHLRMVNTSLCVIVGGLQRMRKTFVNPTACSGFELLVQLTCSHAKPNSG